MKLIATLLLFLFALGDSKVPVIPNSEQYSQWNVDTTRVSRKVNEMISYYTAHADRYQIMKVEHHEGDYLGTSLWFFEDSCSLRYMHEESDDKRYAGTSHYFFENEKLIGLREKSITKSGGYFSQIAFQDLQGATYYQKDAGSPVHVSTSGGVLESVEETRSFELYIHIGDLKSGWDEDKSPDMVVIDSDRSTIINGAQTDASIKKTLSRELWECLIRR
jgi:hypothetical protein